jgi:transcriptional regulator with XRE-family HTH domain
MTLSIRDVRRQQGLTQTAIAQRLGRTQGLIGK